MCAHTSAEQRHLTHTSRQRKRNNFCIFLFSFPRATVRMAGTQRAWRQRDHGDKPAHGASAPIIRPGREPQKFPPAAATSGAPHHLHGLFHPLFDLLRGHRAPAAGSGRGRLLRLHTALGRQRARRRKPGRRGSPPGRNSARLGLRFPGESIGEALGSGFGADPGGPAQSVEAAARRRGGRHRERSSSAV